MSDKIIPFYIPEDDDDPLCSFCHTPQSKCKNFIQSPGTKNKKYICDKCIKTATELIKESK